jgi:hypothetical protein
LINFLSRPPPRRLIPNKYPERWNRQGMTGMPKERLRRVDNLASGTMGVVTHSGDIDGTRHPALALIKTFANSA